MIIAVVLTALAAWGCAARINYSYDLATPFDGLKNYNWGPSSAYAKQFPLIESNIRFAADKALEKKGFVKKAEKPDFMISINYDYEIDSFRYSYEIRMLNLKIYSADGRKLIWQGTAYGTINANKASRDLTKNVERILSKFPPK